MELKLSQITGDYGNTRVNQDVTELMRSIQQNGVIQPIRVRKTGANKYAIVAGNRRFIACKKLGFKTIPVSITDKEDAMDIEVEHLVENVQRKNLSTFELGDAILNLKKEYGLSDEEVAIRLGFGKDWVKTAGSVSQSMPKSVRSRFEKFGVKRKSTRGGLSSSMVVTVHNLYRSGIDRDQIEKLVDTIHRRNLSVPQVRAVAAAMRGGVSLSKAMRSVDKGKTFNVSFWVNADAVKTIGDKELRRMIQEKVKNDRQLSKFLV